MTAATKTSSAEYIADIGLEVHVELATRSKMFCSCAVVDPTASAPNSAVCPVCCGMPGVLPVINRRAVELAIRAALALSCRVMETSIFARKNYFYPDLPKGYQISQYESPLAVDGFLLIHTPQGEKRITIRRAHLEEDTGKLTHVQEDGKSFSLVDLNRAGIPLLEIVSEPDMHSVEDVRAYSRELRLLLRWLGVSSGDMEKGSMRFEANLSMRPADSAELGTRVEIKNLNSFRAMEQAILYQMDAQRAALKAGEKVVQQTLGWDESVGCTAAQRSKEDANDYRYFPEPDLPPLVVDRDWLEKVRADMPELPNAKRARYREDYRLSDEDIERLVEEKDTAVFFEACLTAAPKLAPKSIANWLLTDLFAWLNLHAVGISEIKISPRDFTELIASVENGAINPGTGKEVLAVMLESGKSPREIITEKGLEQISDSDLISEIVSKVLAEYPAETQFYRAGKETIANWLFGQVMRSAGGQANPQVVKNELMRQLKSE
jgi:aspartyl-tRNA(Asn)/glutamyl-tRNA(Gln) amidotransferase subunit B